MPHLAAPALLSADTSALWVCPIDNDTHEWTEVRCDNCLESVAGLPLRPCLKHHAPMPEPSLNADHPCCRKCGAHHPRLVGRFTDRMRCTMEDEHHWLFYIPNDEPPGIRCRCCGA